MLLIVNLANPKSLSILMKTPRPTKESDPVVAALAAKLRLKQYKVERVRKTLRHLEAECERLESEIRRRSA